MHLTLRVTWHENQWDGTVCKHPTRNSFCLMLDRVRVSRNDEIEKIVAGESFEKLAPDRQPACIAEAGAFMNSRPWTRIFQHPYQDIPAAKETHGHLKPRTLTIPPYTTFAVPFWWMLKQNQDNIDQMFKEELPPDAEAPFRTSWVFALQRQVRLSEYFFSRIKPKSSLVFFYCKEGQPLGEDISRLVIGVGTILNVGQPAFFETTDTAKKTYPLWDRLISHSIRPDGVDGFLLPYHEYLKETGDVEEDARRKELLREIAVSVPPEYIRTFSYMSEHASADVALSILLRVLASIRKIKEHGIAKGPWDAREEWVNQQITRLWKERGAFPGLGSALEVLGLRLGTSLVQELYEQGWLKPEEDPWILIDGLLRGFIKRKDLPITPYLKALENTRKTYNMLNPERVLLLKLLSRFSLNPDQMKRWFLPEKRPAKVSDAEILANPYRISETDWGDANEAPISVGIIDRGLFPEATVAARHPIPEPSVMNDKLDPRRVRSVIVAVLRLAAEKGDSFLSQTEAINKMAEVDLVHPCEVSSDWINGNVESFSGVVDRLSLPTKKGDGVEMEETSVLQLSDLKCQEDYLRKILRARALKPIESTKVDWKELIIEVINKQGKKFQPDNPRHIDALNDQAAALEKITTRKLSVLSGRAGTGKTAALGALFLCEPLSRGGILLLAPTGKARVRLSSAANSEAMTVAQFLNQQDRYDGKTHRPLFSGKDTYAKEKTIVIDECSMLTMDDLYALLLALDLGHVQRIILVGDPNQLPPIGTGRPFADFCASLENAAQSEDPKEQALSGALGKLSVEVRTKDNRVSDTLRLASWFTRETQLSDADKVFSDLEAGEQMNDLDIQFWEDPDQLKGLLFAMLQKYLGLENPDDIAGFNRALGLVEDKVDFKKPVGAENFQILTPVRMHPYGVYDLNRLIQLKYRKSELEKARHGFRMRLGDEEIVLKDKVIQNRNQVKKCYNWFTNEQEPLFLANGEIGIVGNSKPPYMQVAFAGPSRLGYTSSYGEWDFPGGSGPLELAYALTVHKSQGSEFETTFIILPQKCQLVTRELLYTAMTRSRSQLVLLVEGKRNDISFLYEFSRPESSEVARRNTNLFQAVVRLKADEPPYAEHLIHKAEKGHMVRSKSELVIANKLFSLNIPYEYERRFELPSNGKPVRPDFRFTDAAGDTILWEHLGLLHKDDYRESWNRKLQAYRENGFIEGVNLFTTRDDERGGLDSIIVSQVATQISDLL